MHRTSCVRHCSTKDLPKSLRIGWGICLLFHPAFRLYSVNTLLLCLALIGGSLGSPTWASAQSTDSTPILGSALIIEMGNETSDNRSLNFSGCGGELVAPTDFEYEQTVVYLTNQARANNNLPPLKLNKELSDAARYHSADMFQDDYFEHDSFDREDNNLTFACSTWDRIQTYYPSPQAENIAFNYRSPEEVVEAWLGSPGHYRNIMSDYREIGVGLHEWYWNQDFGTRNSVHPVIINGEAVRTDQTTVTVYVYGAWEEMRLRNDGADWSDWRPFQNQSEWTISALPGLRTVGVEVRSGATTYTNSDAIEYIGPTGQVPTPTLLPPTPASTEVPPTPMPPTLTPLPPTDTPTAIPPTPTPQPTSISPTLVAPTPILKPTITNTPATTPLSPTPTSTSIQKPTVTSTPEFSSQPEPITTETPLPVAPEVSPEMTPTQVVTATATPGLSDPIQMPTETVPISVALRGRVQLQGRPPLPHPRWQTALTVDLHDPFTGDLLHSYPAKTDEQGIFNLAELEPGIYQIGVKGNHTLQTGQRVNIKFGDAEVDFGLLKEGDANGDNAINIWDFAMWRRSQNSCEGSNSFNLNSDFDQNGCTDQDDAELLFRNFGERGTLDSSGAGRGTDERDVSIQPLLTVRNKKAGERFVVHIRLATIGNGMAQVRSDSSTMHLRYMSDALRAIGITGHPSFDKVVENRIDNQHGHLDFSAVALGEPAVLDGPIVSVLYEAVRDIGHDAINNSPATTIEIVRSGPDVSDVAYNGDSLLQGGTTGPLLQFVGQVELSEGTIDVTDTLFLPLMVQ